MDATLQSTRYTVILPALCWGRYRPDFYAVTDLVSSEGIRFRSATRLASGETLACSIRGVGAVETHILRADGESFVARIAASRADRIAVTRALVDLARRQQQAEPERASPRVVPRHKDVIVTAADGSALPGRLLNVSTSGAAVALTHLPALGEEIRIGDLAATVVRHFAEGIGAAFAHPLESSAVTEAMTLFRPALASDAPRV